MAKNPIDIKLASVEIIYKGNDNDFNFFLKNLIHDYLLSASTKAKMIGNDENDKTYEKELDL